ncbi:MAG: ABC transporter permease subunit [Spirochaetota bacterium]|nr:MAG: ABC transporter permease subunit [Spirochaetota bacterium]
MRNIAEIYKREIRFYFATPIAYVVIIIFTIIFGFFFYRSLVYYSELSYQLMQNAYYAQRIDLIMGVFSPVFSNNAIIFLMVIPPISMRLIAEEKKSGTIELLFTFPIKDIHIVLGKWLAASTIIVLMLVLTLPAPFMAFKFAGAAEWGPVLAGYLGMLLMGLSFLSLGILISALSENQIVSIIVSYGVLLAFWFLGWIIDPGSGKTIGKVLGELSIIGHLSNFVKGMIDTKDIIYFVLFIFMSLFLTLRVLESKRWRG